MMDAEHRQWLEDGVLQLAKFGEYDGAKMTLVTDCSRLGVEQSEEEFTWKVMDCRNEYDSFVQVVGDVLWSGSRIRGPDSEFSEA